MLFAQADKGITLLITQRTSLRWQERAIISQMNIRTISEATLQLMGNIWEMWWNAYGLFWACRSIPSWTELNSVVISCCIVWLKKINQLCLFFYHRSDLRFAQFPWSSDGTRICVDPIYARWAVMWPTHNHRRAQLRRWSCHEICWDTQGVYDHQSTLRWASVTTGRATASQQHPQISQWVGFSQALIISVQNDD